MRRAGPPASASSLHLVTGPTATANFALSPAASVRYLVMLACAPAWEASNFAAQGADPWRALRQVRCPVRIFRAEHGSTFRAGPGFGGRRADVTVESVAGATHFLPMERPELVRAALLQACTREP